MAAAFGLPSCSCCAQKELCFEMHSSAARAVALDLCRSPLQEQGAGYPDIGGVQRQIGAMNPEFLPFFFPFLLFPSPPSGQ
jgi:hypothetical protein